MADGDLPFLRGRIEKTEAFKSARGGGGKKPALPPRDPRVHRAALMAQLDQLVADVEQRASEARDPEATREIVAVIPEAGAELAAPSLADAASDVRLVGADPTTGVVLIDTPDPNLPALRRKIDEFADANKLTPKGHPQHMPLVAPVREIRRPQPGGCRRGAAADHGDRPSSLDRGRLSRRALRSGEHRSIAA